MPGVERGADLVAQSSEPPRSHRDWSACRPGEQEFARFGQLIELVWREVPRQREVPQFDYPLGSDQAGQRLSMVCCGERLERTEPGRLAAAAARRKRVDDTPAGQCSPRGMVSQYRPVAAQGANRVLEVDLHKTRAAWHYLAGPEDRDTTDGIRRAEMQMDRQAIAQRRLAISRNAQREIEPGRRRMPFRGDDPIAATGLGALGK